MGVETLLSNYGVFQHHCKSSYLQSDIAPSVTWQILCSKTGKRYSHNSNLTSKANAKQQFEHLDVENLPDPDAKFQQVWQDFLQSARERLETE